ncbi:30S ribosomal protein S13 [Candidatus Peregrinibacteria bacterium]|nr:30S ribosomal protein S13 [Candidatus Peregrinibacteria bacterium]
MARIAGVNLPKDKRIEIGLTAIYGIGRSLSRQILADIKLNPDTKVKDLAENEIAKLREAIGKLTTEGDLRRKTALDIKRLQDIGSYRGFRHRKKLPVRGQRTKTNARTKKGKKVTVANKKVAVK